MKSFYQNLLLLSLLLVAGCNDTPVVVESPATAKRTFTLSASMPGSGGPDTRVTARQLPDSLGIALKWKEGDKIQLYFKSGDTITQGNEVEVQNISIDGKKADFTVTLPSGVSGNFHLYGVHGTSSVVNGDSILLDATPGNFVKLEDAKVPLYFKQENVDPASPGQSVIFQHFGALQVITLKNRVNQKITLENPSLVFSGDKWYHDAIVNEYPLYDIVSGKPTTKVGSSPSSQPFTVDISYDDNVKLAQWVMPNVENPPAIQFKAEKGGTEYATSAKDARTSPLVVGNAYHLYALWERNGLYFTEETAVQVYKITMTTTKEDDEKIVLIINAAGEAWIDLNNNGAKDEDEVVSEESTYTIASQIVSLYGKVTNLNCTGDSLTALDVSNNTELIKLLCFTNSLTALDVSGATALTILGCYDNFLTALDVSNNTVLTTLGCHDNSLTALDVSNNTALTTLYCYNNKINGLEMDKLVNSLPVIKGQTKGEFRVINTKGDYNVCTTTQVDIATGKNWEVKDSSGKSYPGS